jgi:hypothetical protein
LPTEGCRLQIDGIVDWGLPIWIGDWRRTRPFSVQAVTEKTTPRRSAVAGAFRQSSIANRQSQSSIANDNRQSQSAITIGNHNRQSQSAITIGNDNRQ